jgi:3-hydroxyacyl-CoA dehydrogenase
MSSRGVVSLEIEGDIGVITIDNPPVSGISAAVRGGLVRCLEDAAADADVHAVVLFCAGDCFLSGLDVREFGRELPGPSMGETTAALINFDKPLVVAAHGVALGGGVECLLCCDYRAVRSDTELGLMEVTYGLLPGAGGTQLLPRLIGAEPALEMLLSGRRIDADRAHALGLVDEVFGSDIPVRVAAVAAARRWLDAGCGKRRVSEMQAALPDGGEALQQLAADVERRNRCLRAPARIARCVMAAVQLPFAAGLDVEHREHEACEHDPQHPAMLHAFFSERRSRKLPPDIVDRAAELRRVAVIGAGTMGRGIALACLRGGYEVCLVDREPAVAERARDGVVALLERDQQRRRIGITELTQRCDRLRASSGLDDLGRPDVVIEAVFEDLALKRQLFATLDAQLPDAALLASNTSTLDIEAMADATGRPERVLGLHFFSPARIMPLVEIVAAPGAAEDAIATARSFVSRLGKIGVVVGNGFGFVGNRMLYAYGRENQLMLLEGASPSRIDRVLTDFGMAMGPNAVGDLTGLDVGYHARRAWPDRPADPRFYRVADALVEAGRLGQKTGRGAYRYEQKSRAPLPDDEVEALIAREAAVLGIARRVIDDAEILERCLLALIVEGVRLLESGVARSGRDIDVIWINGYGFPRHRGGPMYYGDRLGVSHIVERVGELARQHGDQYWSLPPMLRAAAISGQRLVDLTAADHLKARWDDAGRGAADDDNENDEED